MPSVIRWPNYWFSFESGSARYASQYSSQSSVISAERPGMKSFLHSTARNGFPGGCFRHLNESVIVCEGWTEVGIVNSFVEIFGV